jgi:isocitrate dehydrogenase kinase/phosphatase
VIPDNEAGTTCAIEIFETFEQYQDRFRQVTRRAHRRFMRRQWALMQADALERLDLYQVSIGKLAVAVRDRLGNRQGDRRLWETIKSAYTGHLAGTDAPELARTFFNSVSRRIFTTVGVDARIEFTADAFDTATRQNGDPVYRTYPARAPLSEVVSEIITNYGFGREILREKGVLERITAPIERYLEQPGKGLGTLRFEMHRQVFYRGQGAYLIGRMVNGARVTGIVFALIHLPRGIRVEAVLLGVPPIRILFSFTRSAFHVLTGRPGATVSFLDSILESKPEAEIYSALGYYKHGKTLLYRDLRQHTRECTADRFEISAGQRGMVMIVFDMANDHMVLKLIRDQFQKPKNTTRQKVMAQYDFVFKHYRVGRLIEAQPFEYLAFDICWFTEALLEELAREASRTVRIEKDRVIIRHAYVERRVTPLDLFLAHTPPEASGGVVIDFGNAIKDLAFSNVFPGDMLLKNFGVTRHGRVVFYDYDEIVPVTECNFRKVPTPRNHLQEMASEPWYYVAENDVFPEEHARFLGLSPGMKEIFMQHHQDLFHPHFWQNVQADIRAGKIKHILPYAPDYRLEQT